MKRGIAVVFALALFACASTETAADAPPQYGSVPDYLGEPLAVAVVMFSEAGFYSVSWVGHMEEPAVTAIGADGHLLWPRESVPLGETITIVTYPPWSPDARK